MDDYGINDRTGPPHRPSPFLKTLFELPSWLYRHGWGRALGTRLLALTHTGRKSGREFQTILESVSFDHETGESIVASAYGVEADWYQNITVRPAHRIITGRLDYVPEQSFLTDEEALEVANRFCREHPFEARLIPKVLPAIGAAVPKRPDLRPSELLAALPMVAFRPSQ